MLSLAGATTSIIFVATKHVLCRDKSMLAATKPLWRQNSCLSWQKFCRDKHTFVATKDFFVATKDFFVATKLVSTKMILVAARANDSMRLWMSNTALYTARFQHSPKWLYSAVWMLHGWCHVELLPSWCRSFVHHTIMHQFSVTFFEATYVGCMCVLL